MLESSLGNAPKNSLSCSRTSPHCTRQHTFVHCDTHLHQMSEVIYKQAASCTVTVSQAWHRRTFVALSSSFDVCSHKAYKQILKIEKAIDKAKCTAELSLGKRSGKRQQTGLAHIIVFQETGQVPVSLLPRRDSWDNCSTVFRLNLTACMDEHASLILLAHEHGQRKMQRCNAHSCMHTSACTISG